MGLRQYVDLLIFFFFFNLMPRAMSILQSKTDILTACNKQKNCEMHNEKIYLDCLCLCPAVLSAKD